MGTRARISDGLMNAITGQGTTRDPRSGSRYVARPPLTQQEIHAAYTGSGLMRKIIRIPALDMVREGRCWEMERDQIEALEAEEKRHGLAKKLLEVEILRALGGGALVLGLPGEPSEPVGTVAKGGLSFVNVVSRWHLSFIELEQDATAPGFGEPRMWRMSVAGGQMVEIHPSRVIPFRADTSAYLAAPGIAGADYAFWGESVVQQVLDAVQDNDAARGAFASLLSKARLTRIGIPGLSELVSTSDGEKQLTARLAAIALAESMFNASVYDAGMGSDSPGEAITDVTYSFAGAKDVLNAYAEFACAIADIPATRLLGRAPEGMNSSGDSQQKDWAKKIRAKQTLELAPCLDRLDVYLIPSALGSAPAKVDYDFEPLETPDADKEAARFKATADALTAIANLNAMPERAFAEAAQNTLVEGGWMPGLGQALDAIPEDERFGVVSDPSAIDPSAMPATALAPITATDAALRTLYVSRPVLNREEIQRWASEHGLGELQPNLHVTIAASRQQIDWMKLGGEDWNQKPDGTIEIPPGGVRIVEPLGNRTAVLLFTSSSLSWRHQQILNAGASWDHADYQPHISLTGDPVNLSSVEPYRGIIRLGPERFEEFNGGVD